jgi:hypothetical protein
MYCGYSTIQSVSTKSCQKKSCTTDVIVPEPVVKGNLKPEVPEVLQGGDSNLIPRELPDVIEKSL